MIDWSDEQLEAVGLDKKQVASMVRRFRRLSREMQSMGLHLYGNSGSGCLIHVSRPTHGPAISGMNPDMGSVVARVGQGFDGGDW